MTARILSIATATPPHQADLALSTQYAQRMSCHNEDQAGKVKKLYQRTGVETRGSVLLEESSTGELNQSFYPPMSSDAKGPSTGVRNDRFATDAPLLARRASDHAIKASGVAVDQITHLITVTCTGFYSPGIDVDLIDRLGLPSTTQRVQIGFMGCHALINALRTARGLVAADPQACVLICSVELCSLHYQYGYDAQAIVSGSLFADGAAGAVVVGADFEHPAETTSDSSSRSSIELVSEVPSLGEIAATGSCLVSDSREAMTWTIGDHGFEMTLEPCVPGLIETHLAAFLNAWLIGQGETIESIGGWAVHPGGVRILQAIEKCLNLDPATLKVSREVLRRHGNMSSATLGAVLGSFQHQQIPRPWLMLGFGPGLEIEVALIR